MISLAVVCCFIQSVNQPNHTGQCDCVPADVNIGKSIMGRYGILSVCIHSLSTFHSGLSFYSTVAIILKQLKIFQYVAQFARCFVFIYIL